MTEENQCVVCGTTETPEKGWIYRMGDVELIAIHDDGSLEGEPHEDADALCSIDCKDVYVSDGDGDGDD